MKKSLSTGQLAKYCGVGHRTVLRWIKLGYLSAFQLPGRGDNRVPIEECVRFMQEHSIPIPDEMADAVTPVRILIVEDDEALADNMNRMLRRDGFETNVAYDGFQAGALLASFRPAVMLLDLRIPRLDGYEVLQFVREDPKLKDTKVVVISGLPEEDLEKARSAGADSTMRKPLNPTDVVKEVNRLLKRQSPVGAVV